MKKFFKKLSLKKVLYAVLSFILALCIIFCSMIIVARITFFNGNFLSDTLNSSEYYKDLCVEITENLTDLGDASGLKKSFFEGFVNEVLVREDVQAYVSDFYEGKTLRVNTSKFDESLQNALDKYIKVNKIKNVNEESIQYFSANASKIYSDSIKIKYLSSIQDIILNNGATLTIGIVILLLLCAAIVCVLIFTNEWKHKSLRYIYTATCSSGLFLLILPISVFASGVIGRIAIMSRSLSDMYVAVISSVQSDLIVISIVLLVISAALWVIHGRVRRKAAI
ncbi:MAG: hypothetical protein IJ725_03250 [Ruminococcus sp.]|nr:hypothetical protein [Ruminococcus sp.]